VLLLCNKDQQQNNKVSQPAICVVKMVRASMTKKIVV